MKKIFLSLFLFFVLLSLSSTIVLACGPMPAEICTPERLKVRPMCLNGSTWDYDEQLCTERGRSDICGGVPYCCPSTGGSWTTDMTACPQASTPTPTATPTPTDIIGDANGDRLINLFDFAIWRKEYLGQLNTLTSDFDQNNIINLYDFAIWRVAYFL